MIEWFEDLTLGMHFKSPEKRLTRDDIVLSGPTVAAIAAGEQSAVEHMNADHADALDFYARHFAGARDTGWRAVAVDPGYAGAQSEVDPVGLVQGAHDLASLRAERRQRQG